MPAPKTIVVDEKVTARDNAIKAAKKDYVAAVAAAKAAQETTIQSAWAKYLSN